MEQKRLISLKLKKREKEREMEQQTPDVFDGRAFLTEEEFFDRLEEIVRKKKQEKTEKKILEKVLTGWDEVHLELKAMPRCFLQDQATRVFFCRKCNSCGITGKCVACMNRGITHSLVDREVVGFLPKSAVEEWL